MGVLSIVAGVVAFVLMIAGLLLTVVPMAGTVASFSAPLVALAGIVLGGLAVSRAKQDGMPAGIGIAGIVVSSLAFVPAVVFALTCGLCNACVTAETMSPGGTTPARWLEDGGPAQRGPTQGAPGSPPSPGPGQPDRPAGSAPPPPGSWASPDAGSGH